MRLGDSPIFKEATKEAVESPRHECIKKIVKSNGCVKVRSVITMVKAEALRYRV